MRGETCAWAACLGKDLHGRRVVGRPDLRKSCSSGNRCPGRTCVTSTGALNAAASRKSLGRFEGKPSRPICGNRFFMVHAF